MSINFGPPARDLKITVRDLPGSKYVQHVYGAPQSPVARACLWERDLHQRMGSWFEFASAAGMTLGMGIVVMTKQLVVARLHLTEAHRQPAGMLHGGISALIMEELGSMAASINSVPHNIVGVNLTATHVSGAKVGDYILAVCTPVKGRGSLQVWKTDIYFDDEQTDDSLAFTSDPFYHLTHQPKGRLLATGQLTTSQAKAPKKDQTLKSKL